jgi:spore maturation protein CgeB
MPARYAGARVALAPLVRFLREHPAEITHRVFEAAACGAFQITHRTPVTDAFFPEGTLVAADSDAAFVARVEEYLPDAGARNQIALRALEHVHAHHTVFSRVEQLLDWLDTHAPVPR